MNRGRRLALGMLGAAVLLGSLGLEAAAPAAASVPYSVTSAIRQGTTWLTFSDTPLYSNEPKLTPGVHTFRVTLANRSTQSVSITSISLGIPGAPTTCVTAAIKPGKSGSCTVAVTIAAGPLSFGLTSFLSTNQTFVSATHVLIGVSYSLTTTVLLTTPGGPVAPGDPALAQLPLGYIPTANLQIRNGSTVTLTSLTVPGFNTSACASNLKALLAGTLLLCNGVPARVPASTTPVILDTGAVGNGVFPGDRPGLGVSLSYQGVGGCTAAHSTVLAGTTQSITCTGFEPGIRVGSVLHSTAVSLGSHLVPQGGTFTFGFTVPVTTSGGAHTLSLTVGGVAVTSAGFMVTAALPETGSDPSIPFATSLVLLMLGAGFTIAHVAASRRARRRISS